jgi:hypothetical protein
LKPDNAKWYDARKRGRKNRRAVAPAAAREIQSPLDREELVSRMQDSLEPLAIERHPLGTAGLENEVTRLYGRR